MIRYIIRRLLWVLVTLLLVSLITYTIFFVMPSTDPAVNFAGKQPTPELVARVREQFGLDKPFFVQYGLFVGRLFFGDDYGWPGLGFSFSTRSELKPIIFDRLLVTALTLPGLRRDVRRQPRGVPVLLHDPADQRHEGRHDQDARQRGLRREPPPVLAPAAAQRDADQDRQQRADDQHRVVLRPQQGGAREHEHGDVAPPPAAQDPHQRPRADRGGLP